MTEKDTVHTLSPDDEITIDGIGLLGDDVSRSLAVGTDDETIDGAALIAELTAGTPAESQDLKEPLDPKEEALRCQDRWQPPAPALLQSERTQSRIGRLNLAVFGLVFAVCIAGSCFL